MEEIKSLVSSRLQALHPKCLIRDVVVSEAAGGNLSVSYIKVNKDDTYYRCTLAITMEKGD
jgi:hypothetical protein